MTVQEVIHKAIKDHAGLSDFDDEAVIFEVYAILEALWRAGFQVERIK